jgi:SAM-dependent methyltransferase
MNRIHRVYCRSALWRRHLGEIVPWATDGVPLDGNVLELGSGPGLATDWLRTRVGGLTAVEYDEADAADLAIRAPDVEVHHGDATDLPFDDATFDAVLCFTMLHHVPSVALQDRLFAEACRVLKPSGVFAGSDSRWGPLFAVAHIGDTLQLVDPDQLPGHLTSAGFSHPEVSKRRGVFRFRAARGNGDV